MRGVQLEERQHRDQRQALVGVDERLTLGDAMRQESALVAKLIGITWFGWTVPAALEVATVFALGMLMLGIAIWEFNAGE